MLPTRSSMPASFIESKRASAIARRDHIVPGGPQASRFLDILTRRVVAMRFTSSMEPPSAPGPPANRGKIVVDTRSEAPPRMARVRTGR